MPSLSVIMIVKNEAAVLADCLASVAGIADEVVVADTGSTDDTPSIAARAGARVFDLPWEDDFAQARNETIRRATGDWLLHMDADEVLDPAGARELRAIVDSDDASDAVTVTLANYTNDARAWRWVAASADSPYRRGYAGYLPVPLLRLFRNHRGFEYREAVHENISASIHEVGGRIRSSDALIHHYGYALSPARRQEKAQQYFRLARKKLQQTPDDLKCLYDLAEQALACGAVEAAEEACRHAVTLCPGHLETTTTLANICLNRGDLDEAHALLQGLETAGSAPPHVQTALGAIALHRGDFGEAEARLSTVRSACPPAPVATLYLARVYDYRGEGKAALAVLEELAASVPVLEEVGRRIRSLNHRQAGEARFGAGDGEGALESFVAALSEDAEDGLTHNNIGVVMHAMGDVARARTSFERALRLAPCLADARANLAACQDDSG